MFIDLTVFSEQLRRTVPLHVILPYHDGYPDAPRPYPLLIFLPGFTCCAEDIIFGLPMRQMSAQYGIAIALPDTENAFCTDHPERCACHGRFVGEELPALLRTLFPCLSSKREETFIGGISMGGYGAAAMAFAYPDTFGRVMLFSPSAEPDDLLAGHGQDRANAADQSLFNDLFGSKSVYDASPRVNLFRAAEKTFAEGGTPQPIWMCCGTEDELVGRSCEHFSDTLFHFGFHHSFVRGEGGHELPYWDRHLEEGFRFLAERNGSR